MQTTMQTTTDAKIPQSSYGLRQTPTFLNLEALSDHREGLQNSARLIELTKKSLQASVEKNKPSFAESCSRRAVTILESTYTQIALGCLYGSALGTSLAASVFDFIKAESNNCTRPVAPLVLDVVSAVVSLLTGTVEILGAAGEHQTSDEREAQEDAFVKKVVKVLEEHESKIHSEIPKSHSQGEIQPVDAKEYREKFKEELSKSVNSIAEEVVKQAKSIQPGNSNDIIIKIETDEFGHNKRIVSMNLGSEDPLNPRVSGQKEEGQEENSSDLIIEIEKDELKQNERTISMHLERSQHVNTHVPAQKIEKNETEVKTNNIFMRLLRSKQRNFAEQALLSLSIVLSGASSITDLIINNSNDCDRPPSVLGLSSASIGLLSVVTLVWMFYWSAKKHVEIKEHDERVLKKLLAVVEENANFLPTNMGEEQIKEHEARIRRCLHLYDKLADSTKNDLHQRDLWVTCLLNTLPEGHPFRSLKDEILKGLHPHRRSISSEPGKIGPAQIDLANQLFNAAERIIGEPVEFIALGEYSILRDGKGYQMRKTESINIGRNSPTDSL